MTTIRIEVANLVQGAAPEIVASIQRSGQEVAITLRDDGVVEGDVARDGIWVGRSEGEALRLVPLRLHVGLDGAATEEAWAALEPVDPADGRLVYQLTRDDGRVHVERVAAPFWGQPRPDHERERVDVAGVWTILVFLVVAFHAWHPGRR